MPEVEIPDGPPTLEAEPFGVESTFLVNGYTDLAFTPVFDGQAFASAPFLNIFKDLGVKLNSLSLQALAGGALNHEHFAAGNNQGYVLHSQTETYSKTASLPPGVWVHSSVTNNVVTRAGSSLNHYTCGRDGPVGKTNKPTLKNPLRLQSDTEIFDAKQKGYASGLLVCFDGIIRLIGDYEDHTAPRSTIHAGIFYFVMYANVSVNGGAYNYYPIPVTERYVDCVPKDRDSGYPLGRDGLNINFRHMLTSRSIPLNHVSDGSTPEASDITSIKVRDLRVGVALNRRDTGTQQIGFHIASWNYSYLALSGEKSRIVYVPNVHGNLA